MLVTIRAGRPSDQMYRVSLLKGTTFELNFQEKLGTDFDEPRLILKTKV